MPETVEKPITVGITLSNDTHRSWQPGDFSVGYQIVDPDTGLFIAEGQWIDLPRTIPPGEKLELPVPIELPLEHGHYDIYVSPVDSSDGWVWARNQPFLLVEAAVDEGPRVLSTRITTLAVLRWRRSISRLPALLVESLRSLWANRLLITTLVRRDVMARYRGSFFDTLWTILNPLLLMATYFFVFGVVLQTRFGPEQSRTGFAFYFLAGMLPWLAFSDAVGRAPTVVLEHRNFVKKLVFPVETLSIIQTASGLVTEFFGLAIFLIAIAIRSGAIPVTVVWLPALVVPQVLFTLGCAWFLSALGVFARDLGHVMGFLLTLWFFITPICYPETQLPHWALPILGKNPIYTLVSGYRAILLEARAPEWHSLWKLWIVASVVFLGGHAWFYKFKRSFPDVL